MRKFILTVRKHSLLSPLFLMIFFLGICVYAKATNTEAEFDYKGLRYYIVYDEMGEVVQEAALICPYDSLIKTYKDYSGDIIIADSVPHNGKMHPVKMILATFDSISSIYIPNTVCFIENFFECRLDSINLPTPMWTTTYSFYMSYIREFVFRENPDGPEGVIVELAGGGFWSQCENVCIDIAPVQKSE